MLHILSALAVQAASPAQQQPAADPCAGDLNCAQATAAQLFALADRLFERGDSAGAEQVLLALTQDPQVELRSEARFRIAVLREARGDLAGAAASLRDLLAEQPGANRARLELARILAKGGDAAAANKEFARAEAIGLPPEVAVNVRRFTGRLAQATDRRGLSIEITAGPDTNINRSTSSPFIDTIIAPFELSGDARRIGGFGTTGIARAYSRDPIGPAVLLSRLNGRADIYDKSRFNDFQLSADSGPEFTVGKMRVRPSALIERRWYGGDLYQKGVGGDLSLLAPISRSAQIELRAARVRQDIVQNDGQDGWRTSIDATFTQLLAPRLTGQFTLRHARLDARVDPESVRTWGGSALVAYQGKVATVYGEAGYSATHGIEPLFLFGNKRHDRRIDLTAGAIFTKATLAGFQPLVRVSYSDSRADIVLWDFRRFRLDIGITRNF